MRINRRVGSYVPLAVAGTLSQLTPKESGNTLFFSFLVYGFTPYPYLSTLWLWTYSLFT